MAEQFSTFRIDKHSTKDNDIVEVFAGDVLIAAIYPTEGGIKIVSKYLPSNPLDAVSLDAVFPRTLSVQILR